MSKIAIYPGTFDPITFGHIDVIKKSLKLFDKIVVGVSDESNKNYLFSSDERIEIVNQALFKDLKLNRKKIELTINKKLNETDWNILLILLENPEATNKEISEQAFLSIDGIGSALRRMYIYFDVKETNYKKVSLIKNAIEICNLSKTI